MSYLARDVVVATGATTTFAVPFPYLAKEHVKVYLDDVLQSFNWLNDSLISITPAPSGTIRVQRETPDTERLVDFTDTANLDAATLDNSALQVFFIAQELADRTTDTESDVLKLVTDMSTFQSQLDTQSLHLSALDSAVADHYQELQAHEAALGSLQDTVGALQNNLANNYYTKTAVYTKQEVDALIAAIPTGGGTGGTGANGTNGVDGKSAYQIALDNGFVGTQAQWLASLKGQKGDTGTAGTNGTNGTNGHDGANGVDGKSAYQVALDNGFVGTQAQWLASLVGPAGKDGTNATGGSGGTLQNIVTFRNEGTYSYTVPAGVTQLLLRLWGGGGAGSNVTSADGSGNYYKGSGGGGGAYTEYLITVTPGDVLTITVGAGGSSPAASSDRGNPGGQSSVAKAGIWSVQASGGQAASGNQQGGGGQVDFLDPPNGKCLLAVRGQDGQEGLVVAASSSATASYYSGSGGNAGGGGGNGGQGRRSVPNSSGDLGYAGCIPGGGGGGADEMGRGGAGAQGLVIIRF